MVYLGQTRFGKECPLNPSILACWFIKTSVVAIVFYSIFYLKIYKKIF